MKRGSIVILALVVVAVIAIIAFKLAGGPAGAPADDAAPVPIETVTGGGAAVAAGPPAGPGLAPAEQLEQALAAGKPAFVLFHSTTCIPCIEMEKIVNRVRPDFAGRVVFVDVIVSEARNQDLIRWAGIRVIPTSIIFDAQGQARQGVGVIAENVLRAELQKLVEQQP